MIITGKITVFCPTCEQNVVLRRKNFEHIYHEILCFSVILTAGLGFILYLILKYSKKKDRCPNCEAKFDLNNLIDCEILEKDITN
ncbi:MAG: LITAF-like zinc ribbon domain-containing protein [Candidatus Lokiarchaeota archaeon]|nr:LITAF-like zinc ribbon domain-containing protein [Candidatus Lokiarchaeota archaeon]